MSKPKPRVIEWVDFDWIANCPRCPLWTECAYGWRTGTKRAPSNCKLWRRLKVYRTEKEARDD